MTQPQETPNTPPVELLTTRCAICGTAGAATQLYPANFDFAAFNPAVFSARRLPDRIHYRMVRCNRCGLVRSDPIAPPEVLAALYAESTFDYGTEVASLQATYGRYLDSLAAFGAARGALLEVGCGNGFFLEEARRRGYATVHGVEPSRAAIEHAVPEIQPHIRCDVMRPGLFASERYDVICMFQVLDHIPDPNPVIEECFRILNPGGLLLCINHNIAAVSARLMRSLSPIVDIEHTFLFSPRTMELLFKKHGFEIKRSGMVRNSYRMHYLMRLLPFPGALKKMLLATIGSGPIGNIPLSVPLGNLILVARKP